MNHLELAIKASIQAGKKILDIYETSFSVELKEDKTPLTMADRESHKIISEMLSQTGIPILSEEGKSIPYEERRRWERFWLVDPLDGTREFIKRNGEYTVNIALIEGQSPVMGVIYAPVLKRLYFADMDSGAHLVPDFGEPGEGLDELFTRAHRLKAGNETGTYMVVASRSHFSGETEQFVNALRKEHPEMEFVSAGSSLKLCLVAEGSANIYPRLGPTMEWDTAAGQIIVERAGGKVLEYPSMLPLKYNKPELLNPWFIVL